MGGGWNANHAKCPSRPWRGYHPRPLDGGEAVRAGEPRPDRESQAPGALGPLPRQAGIPTPYPPAPPGRTAGLDRSLPEARQRSRGNTLLRPRLPRPRRRRGPRQTPRPALMKRGLSGVDAALVESTDGRAEAQAICRISRSRSQHADPKEKRCEDNFFSLGLPRQPGFQITGHWTKLSPENWPLWRTPPLEVITITTYGGKQCHSGSRWSGSLPRQ